nr:hypothetical protein Iba_chr07dCG7670 [Ipomoea batatas]
MLWNDCGQNETGKAWNNSARFMQIYPNLRNKKSPSRSSEQRDSVQGGDLNTKYFHNFASVRHKKNRIRRLKGDYVRALWKLSAKSVVNDDKVWLNMRIGSWAGSRCKRGPLLNTAPSPVPTPSLTPTENRKTADRECSPLITIAVHSIRRRQPPPSPSTTVDHHQQLTPPAATTICANADHHATTVNNRHHQPKISSSPSPTLTAATMEITSASTSPSHAATAAITAGKEGEGRCIAGPGPPPPLP